MNRMKMSVRRNRVHGWLRLAALLILSAGQAFGADRPNVVFILGDDQAWWDYSFMRRPGVEKAAIDLNPAIYQVAKTPAIDRLADAGLTFTHGYSMPVCRPSLASIITGAFPHQHYITGNDLVAGGVRVPDETVEYRMQVFQTLPRILATRLGYTSFQTGKWWEGHHTNGGFTNGGFRAGDTANSVSTSNPDTRPPQWSGGKPSYVAARHGDWGLMVGRVDYVNQVQSPAYPINYANTIVPVTDFIDAQVAAHQPFFLWYAPMLPHGPYDPPTGLRNIYDALIAEPDEAGDPFAIQYANIERFDGGVGALLDHLDAVGIASNTIVVMLSDNGYIPKTPSAYAPKSKDTRLRGRGADSDHRALAQPHQGGWRTPAPDHYQTRQSRRSGAHRARCGRLGTLARDDRRQSSGSECRGGARHGFWRGSQHRDHQPPRPALVPPGPLRDPRWVEAAPFHERDLRTLSPLRQRHRGARGSI